MVIVLSESQTTSLSVFASSFGYRPVSWFPALTSGREKILSRQHAQNGTKILLRDWSKSNVCNLCSGSCSDGLGLGWPGDYKLPDSAFRASTDYRPGEHNVKIKYMCNH